MNTTHDADKYWARVGVPEPSRCRSFDVCGESGPDEHELSLCTPEFVPIKIKRNFFLLNLINQMEKKKKTIQTPKINKKWKIFECSAHIFCHLVKQHSGNFVRVNSKGSE